MVVGSSIEDANWFTRASGATRRGGKTEAAMQYLLRYAAALMFTFAVPVWAQTADESTVFKLPTFDRPEASLTVAPLSSPATMPLRDGRKAIWEAEHCCEGRGKTGS
jgi:hypothetical protein